MKSLKSRLIPGMALLIFVSVVAYAMLWEDAVDYNTEVKPILNRHCISCHGGVKKNGGFSLLFREQAVAPTLSGVAAILPGDPHGSEMIRRITSKDPEERMPYKKAPLTKEEVSVLRRWIKQGAVWDVHWAYQPVKNTPAPSTTFFSGILGGKSDAGGTEIDLFIREKLKEVKLEPSPIADKSTLLRRVSLDLTGRPAPGSLVDWFLKDNSPGCL